MGENSLSMYKLFMPSLLILWNLNDNAHMKTNTDWQKMKVWWTFYENSTKNKEAILFWTFLNVSCDE